MAVVDVSEHYSGTRRNFLAGWSVTEWDGYVESSRFVYASKGEPAAEVDAEARAEWEAWAAGREEAKLWATEVWKAARQTSFPLEVGDHVTVRATLPPGTARYRDGVPVSFLVKAISVDYPMRVADFTCPPGVILQPESSEFPVVRHEDLHLNSMKITPDTLACKRKAAIRVLVPGDELWNLVFAWPENEWCARWGMFIDGIREDRWEWGESWMRVGDHLAAAGWVPPVISNLYVMTDAQIEGELDRLMNDDFVVEASR